MGFIRAVIMMGRETGRPWNAAGQDSGGVHSEVGTETASGNLKTVGEGLVSALYVLPGDRRWRNGGWVHMAVDREHLRY